MNRKSLRKKVTDLLKAANLPEVGQDVFSQRSIPTNQSDLPIVLVYTKSDAVERFDDSPKSYRKAIDVIIEVITIADDDEKLADDLDDIVLAVEKTIEDDVFLEQNCEKVELKSVLTDVESNGSNPIGSTRIQYTFEIITEAREYPELPDLNTIANNWKLNDNQNNDAKEVINLPQE